MEGFVIWTIGLLLIAALIWGAGLAIVGLIGLAIQAAAALLALAWAILLTCLLPVFWIIKKSGGEALMDRLARRPLPPASLLLDRPAARTSTMWGSGGEAL